MSVRIDVIFDVPEGSAYFGPTIDAVSHAAESLGETVDLRVVRTPDVDETWFGDLPDGVIMGPGTPYTSPSAAEEAIGTAREKGLPLVGT